jgi:hypothetical protein
MCFRSIDLARTYRVSFVVGDRTLVLTRKKGWSKPRQVPLLRLPNKEMSPYDLFFGYLTLTTLQVANHEVQPTLLRSLTYPHNSICASTVASLTKTLFVHKGIDTDIFSPHATRGASVQMYAQLGLKAEAIAELGDWKNYDGFKSFYLRIGAPASAEVALSSLVHTIPSTRALTSDLSSTPGSMRDPGGRERERGSGRGDGKAIRCRR